VDTSIEMTKRLLNNGSATKRSAAGKKKRVPQSAWPKWSEIAGKTRSFALHVKEMCTLLLQSRVGRVSMLQLRGLDQDILPPVGEQVDMAISLVGLEIWVSMVAEAKLTRGNARSAPTMFHLLVLALLVSVARGNILLTKWIEGVAHTVPLRVHILQLQVVLIPTRAPTLRLDIPHPMRTPLLRVLIRLHPTCGPHPICEPHPTCVQHRRRLLEDPPGILPPLIQVLLVALVNRTLVHLLRMVGLVVLITLVHHPHMQVLVVLLALIHEAIYWRVNR
jgi:hypothetical protein